MGSVEFCHLSQEKTFVSPNGIDRRIFFCLDVLLDGDENWKQEKVEQPFTVYILLDGREVLFDDHPKDTETGFLEMVALFVFCALS